MDRNRWARWTGISGHDGPKYPKYLAYEERHVDDPFFGSVPTDSVLAAVTCVREVSGYAVWYRRHLQQETQDEGLADGDYIIGVFESPARDDAIEFAVLASKPGEDLVVALRHLDDLAKNGCQRRKRTAQARPLPYISSLGKA